MAAGQLKPLLRYKSDAWLLAKIDDLAEELSQGHTFTSLSEAGKSHSQERSIPIEDVIQAVTFVANERGLNGSGNVVRSRATKATFK